MTVQHRIDVLVCHESPVLRAGLLATLARHGDLACRESGGPQAPAWDAAWPVIVTDHAGGIRSVGESTALRGAAPRPRVLVVTHSDRECDIRAALAAGVQGYLLLDDAMEQLAPAVRAVGLGGRCLSPRVAARLAETVALESLTQREEEVLGLVVEGLCNKRVASRLGITVGTVKSHLRSTFGKLGASSRTQAMVIAQRRGLLQSSAATRAH